mgnify:CR=1 FL=1
MAGTYSKVYYHLVFSTKGRQESIITSIREELYQYIGGIIRGEKGGVYAIGGTSNHIHILCSFPTKRSLSDMLQRIKGHSSLWIHKSFSDMRDFAWQAGYGVFSVSHSHLETVRQYILTQEEHHKKMDFKDEFRLLLKKHEVTFNENYIWT